MTRRLVGAAVVPLAVVTTGLFWGHWLVGAPPPRPPGGPYVASSPAVRATVWAVGDGADGSTASMALAARIATGGLDRLLYLGDVYGDRNIIGWLRRDGTLRDFRTHYADAYGMLAPQTAPTPGNHEWALRADGYDRYWQAVYGRPPPDYYAFDIAGWRILSLNSQAPHDAGSPQVRWLRRELRRPGTCRLAFWHRPRYSAGTEHGDQTDIAPLWNALAGHATIVVNGHEHDLQRLRPINGITEFVDGAGGDSRYALHSDRRLAFGDAHDGAALRLRLRARHASWAFITATGRTLDSGTLACR